MRLAEEIVEFFFHDKTSAGLDGLKHKNERHKCNYQIATTTFLFASRRFGSDSFRKNALMGSLLRKRRSYAKGHVSEKNECYLLIPQMD
jgi:hypothetical protein